MKLNSKVVSWFKLLELLSKHDYVPQVSHMDKGSIAVTTVVMYYDESLDPTRVRDLIQVCTVHTTCVITYFTHCIN